MAVFYVLVTAFGFIVGSFLTVVIHRVPRGESVISPPSRCPACRHRIQLWHNIPVAGWLVRRGRCARCAAPIAVRYPLVELGTGGAFAVVTARTLGLGLPCAVPAFLYFTAISVALAAIDLEHQRLPNAIVLPSYPVLAVLLAVSSAVSGQWWPFSRAVLGAALLFGFFLLLVWLYPAGIGFGDVRLSGVVGGVLAYVSWAALVVGALAGFTLGALTGVALMASGRGGRKTALPFAPFLFGGAFVGIFAGDAIAAGYVGLLAG
ncbi:MAG TPA: prepilin peptidase [Amycolatopsis sp.]|nr:prepilin peptidase [Amycolatopsis sp.]